ncbi:MAG: hypothetical protein J6S48_00570 [Bacteroidales bacterium]|nr:hypothetical protein [Bacteroidales bacterium]MCR4858401.1 hypothetical protein [Bacteroidales bacterium]
MSHNHHTPKEKNGHCRFILRKSVDGKKSLQEDGLKDQQGHGKGSAENEVLTQKRVYVAIEERVSIRGCDRESGKYTEPAPSQQKGGDDQLNGRVFIQQV